MVKRARRGRHKRAFGVSYRTAVELSNNPRCLAAIVTSGKPLFYPGIYDGYALARAIDPACAKIPPRKVRVRRRLPERTPHVRPAASGGRLLRVAV